MARSFWKCPYVKNSTLLLLYSLRKLDIKKKGFELKSRESVILPVFVGLFLKIYNGKSYIKIFVKKEMVGHKLGEFSVTRKLRLKMQKTITYGKKN